MKHLPIRVEVESPLAIRSDHAPGGAAGSKYIPGTTLIGGLAALYRALYDSSAKMNAYAPLFLSEQVLYPNLYPALFRDDGLQNQKSVPVYPIPKTAQTCKRHHGFLFPDNEENDAHGVRDTLIDWGLFELANLTSHLPGDVQWLNILQRGRDCQRCKEAMDHRDGYYRRSKVKPYPMIAADVESHTRLQTHTGIHRESGTVQESILYNRQVFGEGMQFWGEIIVPDDLLSQLIAFLYEIGPKGLLRLGTGRTRGMGKVTLAAEQSDENDGFTAFSQRLKAFNKLFHDQADCFELNLPSDDYFFALTLHAPLILCDDLFRYKGVIDARTLAHILQEYSDESIPELKDIYHAASVQRVTGWQELWGTPRTAEYAIESGSVFLFSCSSPPSAALLKALFALEEQGMGKRRTEGFGRVRVSDQFHQQVKQEA